jgi:hypothetical protein
LPGLRFPKHLSGLLALFVLFGVLQAQTPSPSGSTEPPMPAGVEGILLLKSGGVVRGGLSLSGDRWFVKNANRETQVLVSNVDLAARTAEELYIRQRQRLTKPIAAGHLALADWCLRNNLLPQAEIELAEAKRLEASHPQLRLYEQRLAIAVKQHAEAAVAESRKPSPASVIQTALVQNVPPSPPAEAMPIGDVAVERFSRRIQPILVNNCTTAGCHSPGGAQTFQLDRALLHGLSNRRTTMTNLQAALAQVDRAEPLHSPLVTIPRGKHGGLTQPVLGPSQAKLVEQLLEWVALVGETAMESPVANANAPSAAKVEQVTSHTEPSDAEFEAAAARRKTRYGANVSTWKPKDAFDPEIFNRHYHGAPAAGPAD